MKLRILFSILVLAVSSQAATTVEDYEKESTPKLSVVNIPNDAARIERSTDHPHDGQNCLKLHYHFTSDGQYLGVANPVKITERFHHLHFWIYGDNSGSSCNLYISDASEEVHKYGIASTARIDFTGWKEVVIDLDTPHEIWGGDKNQKLDYPITAITFEVGHASKAPVESDIYFDSISVDYGKIVVPQIAVSSPPYCSDIKGDTPVNLTAAGFKTVTAGCWRGGTDVTIATAAIDAAGKGSFTFAADQYPHGPLTLILHAENGPEKDNCYLQLYNTGGTPSIAGLPKDPPPAAKEMKLLFADDFDKPLSISTTDATATYFDHKPLGGDFSTLPFRGHDEPTNPFAQVDTFLRIRADARKKSAGLISSVNNEGHGIKASIPCYFECRFLAPNAPGTWPAFWLLTDYPSERKAGKAEKSLPVDELDIIEAYGGEGRHSPNAFDTYMITPHAWAQTNSAEAAAIKAEHAVHNPISMHKHGVPSTWYQTFHTYGCLITETDTVYYCDDIEVARHKTLDVSKKSPFFFLINLATGGGWPVDLSRYNGIADMYVDFVRVYQGK